jgi:hypothetical protein
MALGAECHMRCGRLRFRTVINDFFLLQEASDAELITHFGQGMEVESVRCDLCDFVKATGYGEFELRFAHAGFGGEVEMHFVGFERVIMAFAKLDLPSRDAFLVIQQMFEEVEVHQRALQLVHM